MNSVEFYKPSGKRPRSCGEKGATLLLNQNRDVNGFSGAFVTTVKIVAATGGVH